MIRLLALLLLLSAPAAAAVVYVDADATGSGNGGSWADACTTLQAGLARAASGDQVWVAQGTYKPGTNASNSFSIPDGVAVYGGFLGGEASLGQRLDDPSLVVLSGELSATNWLNVNILVKLPGSATLDTLSVTCCYGRYNGSWEAAILSKEGQTGTVCLRRCWVYGNWAPLTLTTRINAERIIIDRCVFSANTDILTGYNTTERGTVMLASSVSAEVRDCVWWDNTAGAYTTAVAALTLSGDGRSTVSGCVFAHNPAFNIGINRLAPFGVEPADLTACTFLATAATGKDAVNLTSVRSCILDTTPTVVPATWEHTWVTATDGLPLFADAANPVGPDGLWLTDDDGLIPAAASPCRGFARMITSTADPATTLTDIRGILRPQGRDPEPGAYEIDDGNAGPTATPATASVLEDSSAAIGVPGSDPDGDTLTAWITALPAHGSLLPTLDGVSPSGPALAVGDLPRHLSGTQSVLYRPDPDRHGVAWDAFSFLVDDGQVQSHPATAVIDVMPVNDAPVMGIPTSQTVLEDSGLHVVLLDGIDAGTPALGIGDVGREAQAISITATSSDPAIVPHPTVSYTSPGTTGSLAFAPAMNAIGTVTISVTLHDDGGTANGGTDTATLTFTVTVLPVNDPPQVDEVADLTLPEDCTDPMLTTVTLSGISAGQADEGWQALTINVVSSDTTVVGIAGIDHAPGATTAQIHLAMVPDAHGTALVFISLFDDGGTADGGKYATARVFRVTVTPVEDPPILAVNAGLLATAGQTTPLDRDHLRLTDADAPPTSSLVFTLSSPPTGGALRLLGADLAMGATFTQADLDADRLVYRNDGGIAATDSFAITWSDGVSPVQGPATFLLTLTGTSPPAITVLVPGSSWTEGDPPVAIAPGALVTDPDPLPWDHGGLSATLASGYVPGDALSLLHEGDGAGEVGIVGPTISFGGQMIGSWNGGTGGAPLVVAFSSIHASPAAAGAVARRLHFANTGHDPGNALRTIRLVVNDGAAGASAPAEVNVSMTPVDDPPVVSTNWIAVPAGTTVDMELGVSDPDSTTFTWTLSGSPTLAGVTLTNAAYGRLRVIALPGASGRESLGVTVSDLVNPPVAATVELVITGLDEARPHPAGELQPDIFANGLLDTIVRFDCSDLGGTAGLTFQATADAPAGLSLDPVGSDQVRVRWLVPTGGSGLLYQRFGILAIEPAHQAAGLMPVQILVRPQPGGGG